MSEAELFRAYSGRPQDIAERILPAPARPADQVRHVARDPLEVLAELGRSERRLTIGGRKL